MTPSGAIRRSAGPALLAAALGFAGCGPRRPAPAPPPAGAVRIVSLAPNLTEIVCDLGAAELLVGRSSACDYPPGALERVPVAGDFGRPAMERLLALRPTVVLSADLEDKTLPDALRRIGLRHASVPCRTLDDIPRAMRAVGRIAGREAAGEARAADFERGLAVRRASAAAAGPPLRVYAELWHDPLLTVGAGSFISELVRLAGGRNIGDDVAREYFEVSPEWVLTADPDVVLSLGMAGGGDFRAQLAARPGFAGLRAVRRGAVIADLPPEMLLRPGPRILEAADALRARLDRFRAEGAP